MRKSFLTFFAPLFAAAITITAHASDTTQVAKDAWRLVYVDSEELTGEGANNGHAIHGFDDNPATFWHTEWQAHKPDYPHEIQIDLGQSYNVDGFGFVTRQSVTGGKVKQFRFYVSDDTLAWGTPQAAGQLQYPDPAGSAQQTARVFFGAVAGRYVRLEALSSIAGDVYVMMAELEVYHDSAAVLTGQLNQHIEVQEIPTVYADHGPLTVQATASSGLELDYEVLSGPAAAQGNVLTLTGEGGVVAVRVSQGGNEQYYPAEVQISFTVINLDEYEPIITTRLTDSYPLQMPLLTPYPLYASAAIDHPDTLSVTGLSFRADGQELPAEPHGEGYQCWWTPSGYGRHTVEVVATASNGNTAVKSVEIDVVGESQSQTAATLQGAVIDMGTIGSQWYYGTYELPQFVGMYDTILAHFRVSCPSVPGGCDDWDRLAWCQIKAPDGRWVELFRYVTPYRVACRHHVDVTDYASLLQGRVDFRVYIETWGTGGWQMDLDLEYRAGQPAHLYSAVEEVWQGTFSFGDPVDLQPVPTARVARHANARAATLRLVTTGHGWGDNNTGNAAEFYRALHHIDINGQHAFEQDLWQICNPNPDTCTGQQGTWQHARAGWCPGIIARPFAYDLTPHLARAPFDMDYLFQQSYVDLCHPHHPDCVSGVTCADCNADYNPHYRVSAYVVRHSDEPLAPGVGVGAQPRPAADEPLEFDLAPNPTDGRFGVRMRTQNTGLVVAVVGVSGQTMRTYHFDDSAQLSAYTFDIGMLAPDVYFVQIYTQRGMAARKIVLR